MRLLSRRTLLRGCGGAMALPLLEAMMPPRGLPAGEAPRRLAFVFVPNGVHMQDWTPESEGTEFDLPWILAPLEPVKDGLTVLTGLEHRNAYALGDGPGDHARSSTVFLTGAHPKKTGGSDISAGVSVDQVAAQKIGSETRFPSIELGCEAARQSGQCDSGYSCAYSSTISWRTPHTPNGKEINPRLVFERLFGNGLDGESAEARRRRLSERASILDYVREDAARLAIRLGRRDRRKLDEYLEGLREVERRIARREKVDRGEEVDGVRPPAGIPTSYAAHVRLMYDMIVLAFRADLTRVATLMLANGQSNRSYPFLGVRGGHHYLSHHGGNAEKIEQIRKINRFHCEQLAYFLSALRAVEESEDTLLDNCAIVYGSGISDGNRHNHDNLPVLLAGGGGETIAAPRHVRYGAGTPMSNLFVSLLNGVGAPVERFGDSTGALSLS